MGGSFAWTLAGYNEPVYSASGRDKFSAPAWHAFLRQRHGNIATLNQLYGKTYKSFDEVPPDGPKRGVPILFCPVRAAGFLIIHERHTACPVLASRATMLPRNVQH